MEQKDSALTKAMIRLVYNKTCAEITATRTNNWISETLFHVGSSRAVSGIPKLNQ